MVTYYLALWQILILENGLGVRYDNFLGLTSARIFLILDIWRYMRVRAGILRYMEVFAGIWKYMEVYGGIWRYIELYVGICRYM